jgi:hypothetical protein
MIQCPGSPVHCLVEQAGILIKPAAKFKEFSAEIQYLKTKTGPRQPCAIRRATIIMGSASGTPAPAIARLVAVDKDTVRGVILGCNEKGIPPWPLSGREAVPA